MGSACIWDRVGPVSLPLTHGDGAVSRFRLDFYETSAGDYITVAAGDLRQSQASLVRLQSMCNYAHIFGSALCDCKWQLEESKSRIAQAGTGAILFAIDQHGKGVGLKNHFRVYAEGQSSHLELVVAAYEALGFDEDYRRYDGAATILRALGLRKVLLLTNSPVKVRSLTDAGFDVERVPLEAHLDDHNKSELHTKRHKLGHLFQFHE